MPGEGNGVNKAIHGGKVGNEKNSSCGQTNPRGKENCARGGNVSLIFQKVKGGVVNHGKKKKT